VHLQLSNSEIEILKVIANAASILQIQAFAVGGFVRDKILGRTCKDIDIVCLGNGIDLAHEVANLLKPKPKVSFFKNFGTAQIKYKNIDIEFVGARKESYRNDSRKPIVENGTLEDDQLRRDFTINAMAIHLEESNFGRNNRSFQWFARFTK
jgi:poly(A) polymerase